MSVLKIPYVVQVHCDLGNNTYQQDTRFLHTFTSNQSLTMGNGTTWDRFEPRTKFKRVKFKKI